jgi:hypothetical protein
MSQLALVARPPAEVPDDVRQAAELALERTAHLDRATALTAIVQAAVGRREDASRLEARVHRLFADHRLLGEWFRDVPAIRQWFGL